jgi:hypothetical protein
MARAILPSLLLVSTALFCPGKALPQGETTSAIVKRSGTRAATGRDCTQGLVVLQEPARRRGLGRFRKRAPDRGSDRRASTIARNCYILFSFGRSLRGRGWVIAGYRTQQTF